MEILNFIFRLGVVFAIFSFLWFLVHLGISILTGGRRKSIPEAYVIKFIRYFFLVDVTVLFCYGFNEGTLDLNKTIIAGLVLLTYFIGKLQNAQFRSSAFSIRGNGGMQFMNQLKPVFNFKAEAIVIALSVVTFTLLVLFPSYASNPISMWFYESIINIEDTPVFGFIFKIIGFFFVTSIIVKVLNSVLVLIWGGSNDNNRKPPSNEDQEFDDYEEIN